MAGLPPGSRRDFGRRDFASRREHWRDCPPRFWPPSFRSPPSIPAGSWRDYHRDPAEILAAGISLRAESAGGLARRDFGRRVSPPCRESRWDLGGITTGIPARFWPPGFRFTPRALAGLPAEILAAEFSLPAVNPGGILGGLPPGSRRDFGRRDFASRREHWRDCPPRFWPPSFRSPPSIPAGSWRDYHRDPAEILAAGISLRAESAGGLARRDFGRRVSPPCRESRWDLGGITTGIPARFWPPGFRFTPRALAGLPAEILAAEFSLPAVNPGGILGGLPPGSRRDFGRRDFASREESQRELGENSCRDFGRRGSASC